MPPKSKRQQAANKRKAVKPPPRVEEYSDDASDSDEIEPFGKKRPVEKQATSKSDSDSEQDDGSEQRNSSDDNDSESEQDESDDDDDDDEEEEKGPFFTDDNKAWLKPKSKGLLDESEESEQEEDDGDDEDLLEVEREAQLLDEDDEADRLEAEEDMRETVRHHTAIYHLPTPQEQERDRDRVVPPAEVKAHIESILEVLADFKNRREASRPRQDYMDVLAHYLCEMYGYIPELVQYFLAMFSAPEALEFIRASDQARPLVIRTNTLKTRRKDLAAALIKRGVSLDPLASWSKVGLKIVASPVPIGATPEYLSGHYMLQSAASMCPVLALAPEPNECVLDMSAAPGGKTSYIAQLMRNTGTIYANDLKPDRQKATIANLHRLGVKNVVTCTHDGRKLCKLFPNRFDRILLDAPCSGLGVISRDPSVKVQRTLVEIQKCAHLQKELILSAIDSLKVGGHLVYSTCSVSVDENEDVVEYALKKRRHQIKLVDTGLEHGTPGFTRYRHVRFHPSLNLTRRFYPHVHNMDGFYVCKIVKTSNPPKDKPVDNDAEAEASKALALRDKLALMKDMKLVASMRGKQDGSMQSSKPAKKKQRLNAKVTQPRRRKSEQKET
jgi:25S rRNA (cytosine2870-C5)-methyltransferase